MQEMPETLVASEGLQEIEMREVRSSHGRNVPNEPTSNPLPDLSILLRALESRVNSLFAASRAPEWGLTLPQFRAALARSAGKRFAVAGVSREGLEAYLETLHMEDLALATACLEGSEPAWEFFVGTYRGYLRAAAGSITKGSQRGVDAQELADSLFAELFGLVDGQRGEAALFRYFHGRSSLKTWLRTILAQRHIDRLRQSRRWESIEREDGPEGKLIAAHSVPTPSADPHRDRYLWRFLAALTDALAALDPGDRKRLELYYAREKTLAEIGRLLGEHESSVSRHLERARRELRANVEGFLRTGRHAGEPLRSLPPMSDAEIALCFQYAAEDSPIDFRQMFPKDPSGKSPPGGKELP
jgi:RNA polymerase sigma-70 factor (ECF subfamily)